MSAIGFALLSLLFALHTHKHLYSGVDIEDDESGEAIGGAEVLPNTDAATEHGEHGEHWSVRKCMIVLFIATAGVAVYGVQSGRFLLSIGGGSLFFLQNFPKSAWAGSVVMKSTDFANTHGCFERKVVMRALAPISLA